MRRDVLDTIRDWILSGEWTAGMQVVEEDIAARLGVSRPPVREALKVLAEDGVIERIPGKGTFVCEVEEKELRKYIAIRFAIESFVASTLSRRDAYLIEDLRANITHMRSLAEAKKVTEFVRADFEFHCAMAVQADLDVAIRFLKEIQARFQFFRISHGEAAPNMESILEEHETILSAILSGSEEDIRNAIGTHLIKAAERRMPESVPFLRAVIRLEGSSSPSGPVGGLDQEDEPQKVRGQRALQQRGRTPRRRDSAGAAGKGGRKKK